MLEVKVISELSFCTSVMVIYINFVSNNFSATSLVQVSGERIQDQWSSNYMQNGNFVKDFAEISHWKFINSCKFLPI